LKIDPIIFGGFVILHDYELVYYVLRLFGLNIVDVHNRFNDTDADAVISLWFNDPVNLKNTFERTTS